jgi:NOL1/NOP2/sun family putative RNA methylase
MPPVPLPLASYLEFVPEPERYAGHLFQWLPAYVRLNTFKATEIRILDLLATEGVSLVKMDRVPLFYRVTSQRQLGTLMSYHLGYIYPQALSSALPVLALNPRPGQIVLDLCAAPGTKTTHMAQLMDDRGVIVANDRNYGRLAALAANLKRLGITNTLITFSKGGNFAPGERFDRVLVDAPCSGEGKYRLDRYGRIMHHRGGTTNLAAIQKGLITRAFDLLKPGGHMVYSTCTLNPLENEAVVSHLLARRRAKLIPWDPPLKWEPGLTQYRETDYDPSSHLCRRFYPHHVDSVGFFLAKIARPG